MSAPHRRADATVLERLRLPPDPSSARAARLFVSSVLSADDEVTDLAVLLVSELASNVVQHAGTDFEIGISADAARIRIDVADKDARLPTLRDYVAKSVSGRGLHMIAASAARWGFESTTTGKDVWFELERKPA